jgi:hypothetical protein
VRGGSQEEIPERAKEKSDRTFPKIICRKIAKKNYEEGFE